MLIDTHAHLDHRHFTADLSAVLQRAVAAGVTQWVAPATCLDSTRALLALGRVHSAVHPAAGIHPCDANSVTGEGWVNELRALAKDGQVSAMGEIGLDYFHAPPEGFDLASWKAHQARVLGLQLDLAVELGLNAIIHTRESHDDLVRQLAPYTGKLRAVFHCFTGTEVQARQLIDLGHLVSFTGIVTFKNSQTLQATAKALPAGSFMLETDSPYLAPMPNRGKRCEPAFVADTAHFVAALRGVTFEELAADTTMTAESFFQGL